MKVQRGKGARTGAQKAKSINIFGPGYVHSMLIVNYVHILVPKENNEGKGVRRFKKLVGEVRRFKNCQSKPK